MLTEKQLDRYADVLIWGLKTSRSSLLALGSSYTEAFDGDKAKLTKRLKERIGFNDSALYWDLVNTKKKQVPAHLKGGKTQVIYENGKFLI